MTYLRVELVLANLLRWAHRLDNLPDQNVVRDYIWKSNHWPNRRATKIFGTNTFHGRPATTNTDLCQCSVVQCFAPASLRSMTVLMAQTNFWCRPKRFSFCFQIRWNSLDHFFHSTKSSLCRKRPNGKKFALPKSEDFFFSLKTKLTTILGCLRCVN